MSVKVHESISTNLRLCTGSKAKESSESLREWRETEMEKDQREYVWKRKWGSETTCFVCAHVTPNADNKRQVFSHDAIVIERLG